MILRSSGRLGRRFDGRLGYRCRWQRQRREEGLWCRRLIQGRREGVGERLLLRLGGCLWEWVDLRRIGLRGGWGWSLGFGL